METVYFAMEMMGAFIILILLYANIFETKQRTRKRIVFIRLLLTNLIVVVADAITWLDLSWQKMPFLLWALITITYVLPAIILAIFSNYLYEHLADKSKTRQQPFVVMHYFAMAEGILSLALCMSGKMFEIKDRAFYPGVWENFYYLLYLLSLLYFACLLFFSRKKLGIHDLIAALSFCLFPFISIMFSISGLGINLVVPLLSLDMLLIYVLLQSDSENKLLYQSNSDELTGLFNRRAYEDDRMQRSAVPP